ncbi:hypothetical protein IV203_018665 [Nitzschia inconspicua]|uniref:Uncharacterized protein n=1 Tax=Nitzschia inconspicua TaxID=303405 RepID=A0A9K3Q5S5_9STRA|nr:hypothetical protein IV203_018665 [Nitzschia inconspicua]
MLPVVSTGTGYVTNKQPALVWYADNDDDDDDFTHWTVTQTAIGISEWVVCLYKNGIGMELSEQSCGTGFFGNNLDDANMRKTERLSL